VVLHRLDTAEPAEIKCIVSHFQPNSVVTLAGSVKIKQLAKNAWLAAAG
jgi:hypothetical protein